jgi:AcrR family transcriptional regulator
MTTTRPRNAAQTRADILSAARRRFGAEGYERTTLRAIAADVGVDAALVIRYFGSKQDLFAEAADFRIELPDLSGVDPDQIADILFPRFFTVWEEDETFVALLRAAMTSQTAADTLRQVFATQVAPKLLTATKDHPNSASGSWERSSSGSPPPATSWPTHRWPTSAATNSAAGPPQSSASS